MMNQSMRLLFLSCGALLLSSTLAEEKENVLTPTRISFQSLENLLSLDHPDHQSHVDHISSVLEGVGLFSITDIPLFRKEKPETLRELPKCVDALLLKGQRGMAARHVLADGTIRKTIATTGDDPNLLLSSPSSLDQRIPEACETLQQVSGAFRSTVAEVTRTVGRVLLMLQSKSSQNSNNNNNDKPLVLTTKEGDKTYNLAEMVTYGEHLEHFHVYNKPNSTSTTTHPTTTIDWHTDQGLMLVFSPGMMIMNTHNQQQQQQDRKTTFYQQEHDFKIQLPNGTAMSVQFDPIKDDLVVMLGQGVEQYVSGVNFRAVPHSLSLQQQQQQQQQSTNSNRVWYGRMVLPPADAIHPLFHNSGQTFGSIRQELIAARNNNNTTDTSMSVLGCSSSSTTTTTIAKQQRQLQDQTEEDCNLETQHFCWHTCIDYSQDISPTACAAATDDHVVACVNTKTDELWPGNHNPDFNLGCVAAERVEAFYNNTSTSSTEQETNSSSNEGHQDSHSAAEGGLETDDAKDDQLTTAPSSSATTFTGTMGKTTFAMLLAGLVCIF
ncbi:expressed unknown protein [Seminavis robusta]|uniref:Uncharacterized protein n=1 Tax=Seminavis robusta TaxID=568900 RepID=A0A9N8EF84_9STRA|nr:expressed unknown protein [Seminavis robusta]|eukprot:Sro991_g228680.1 n/a (551) ;mRNA; r:11165-12817